MYSYVDARSLALTLFIYPVHCPAGEHPDHCVVIKYVPYVGDSKRAMDEYTSEIFL